MKNQFANFMLDKNFRSAAELIFEATLNVDVPQNVNLNINIDREENIADLSEQMKNYYNQINETFNEISFEKLWTDIFTKTEFSEKQNLKSNDIALNMAQTTYDNAMKKIMIQQYEQIYLATTLTLKATLQGVVDAAIKI